MKEEKEQGIGLCQYITTPHNGIYNVQKNASFKHKYKKNLPTVGGGKPPPTPSPRSVASLPRTTPVDKSWLHHCYWNS